MGTEYISAHWIKCRVRSNVSEGAWGLDEDGECRGTWELEGKRCVTACRGTVYQGMNKGLIGKRMEAK